MVVKASLFILLSNLNRIYRKCSLFSPSLTCVFSSTSLHPPPYLLHSCLPSSFLAFPSLTQPPYPVLIPVPPTTISLSPPVPGLDRLPSHWSLSPPVRPRTGPSTLILVPVSPRPSVPEQDRLPSYWSLSLPIRPRTGPSRLISWSPSV